MTAPAAGPLRLLVTGFGPYPRVRVNPTGVIARRLGASKRLARLGLRVTCAVLETSYAAAGAAVFGVEVGANEFEFADGLDRGTGVAGDDAAAFDAGGRDAVDEDLFGAVGRAGDLRIVGVAGDAGREEDELFEVADVAADEQRQVHEFLARDDGAEVRRGGLESGDVGGDFDRLFDDADLQVRVEGDGGGDV